MLVLTRRVGDSIVIADEIVVTVLEVRSDQVRLGIDAPREVAVHREEVYRQMQGLDASEPVGRSGAARRRMRDGKDRPGPAPDDPAQAPDSGPEAGPDSGPEAGTGPVPEAAVRIASPMPEADGQRAAGDQRTSGSAPGYVNGRPRDAATAPSTETTA